MAALKDIVKGRRSVRTFDGNPVSQEDREKLCAYISGITNPFGIPVEFVLLDAEEYGLSSPVISGEKLYIAGKVRKGPYADAAFGLRFGTPRKFAFSVMIGASYLTTLKDVIYVYDESGYYRKDANMSNVSLRFAIEW